MSSSSVSFTSVRSKARSNLSKNLPGDLADRLDTKLFLKSDKDEANYRQLYKIAVQLIKEDQVKNELISGKLGLNEFMSRLTIQKAAHEAEMKELEWELNEEKAVQLQTQKEAADAHLVEAVKAAKADSASNITSAAAFWRVAKASNQLFLRGSCNLSFSMQALKAMARAESLDKDDSFRTEHYFSFYLTRAFLSICHFEFSDALAAIQQITQYHEKTLKCGKAVELFATVAKELSESIHRYFQHLKSSVDTSAGHSSYSLKKLIKEIPNTANTVSDRKMVAFANLQAGDNAGMGIVTKILKIVDNSSYLGLDKYFTHADWPLKGDESLDSPYRIPAFTFMVTDSTGAVFPLSIFNVHGKVEVKENDILVILDPTVKAVGMDKQFVSCLHAENPNFTFLSFKHWPRHDIAIFYS